MQRTTVMADEELMARLRQIATDEGIPLAEVIRQGLAWRAGQGRRLRLVGAVRQGPPTAIADEAADLSPVPPPWR